MLLPANLTVHAHLKILGKCVPFWLPHGLSIQIWIVLIEYVYKTMKCSLWQKVVESFEIGRRPSEKWCQLARSLGFVSSQGGAGKRNQARTGYTEWTSCDKTSWRTMVFHGMRLGLLLCLLLACLLGSSNPLVILFMLLNHLPV